MATSLRMYATCQQLHTQTQARAMAASGLLGHTELRLHMPPSIALATRGRLQGFRLQLALLDREFDDLGMVVIILRLNLWILNYLLNFNKFCQSLKCFDSFIYLIFLFIWRSAKKLFG